MKRKKISFRGISFFQELAGLFIVISLIPFLFFDGILYTDAARSLDEMSMELATAFCSQMVSSMDSFIERNNYLSRSVLLDNEIIRKLDDSQQPIGDRIVQQLELRKIFQRFLTQNPDVSLVCIVTKNQNCYYSERNGADIDVDVLLEQEWFQNATGSDQDYLIAPAHRKSYCDRDQDSIAISVVRKIYSIYGYEGILIMDMDPVALIQFSTDFAKARDSYDMKIIVVDANQCTLFDSSLPSGLSDKSEPLSQSFQKLQDQSQDYHIISRTTESLDLKVNVVIPRSSILLRVHRLRLVATILAAIMVGIIVLLAVAVARTISNPIRKLQAGMADFEQGVFQNLEIQAKNNELIELENSYNHMVQKVKELIEKVYLAEIKQKNARYLALQTQINPHMLFNTLESIRMNALMNEDESTAGMIMLLGKMFRSVLDSNEKQNHTVSDELAYAESYIALQNMRFKNRFSLEIDVADKYRNTGIIPIIFQPILENSIEHGYRGHQKPLHLSIRASELCGKRLQFLISDDGKGMEHSQFVQMKDKLENIGTEEISLSSEWEEKRRSIGIVNIAERIKLHYGANAFVRLHSSNEKGTCVEIVIPI